MLTEKPREVCLAAYGRQRTRLCRLRSKRTGCACEYGSRPSLVERCGESKTGPGTVPTDDGGLLSRLLPRVDLRPQLDVLRRHRDFEVRTVRHDHGPNQPTFHEVPVELEEA